MEHTRKKYKGKEITSYSHIHYYNNIRKNNSIIQHDLNPFVYTSYSNN